MAKEPILGVEDLLGRFRADGETESSGSFTLDPKKAMERLAQFALPGHYHWIVKVIQSLHLAGAREVRVDANVNSVTLKADCVPSGFDNITELLAQLLADADSSQPSLRHLAAGLQGSLAVSPSEIRLITVSQGEWREYLLKSEGWRDGESRPAPSQSDRFELRLIRNMSEKIGSSWFLLNTDIFDLILGKKSAWDRENKAIAGLCDYTRCAIKLGKRDPIERRFGRPRFQGYDIRKDPNPGAARPSGYARIFGESELLHGAAHPEHHLAEMVVPCSQGYGFYLEPESHATVTNRTDPEMVKAGQAGGFSAAYAIAWKLDPEARIAFWEDGVVLGYEKVNLGCPGLRALVNAKDLSKDVTTLKVREDSKLQEVLQEVKEAGIQLREQVLKNLNLMPEQDRIKRALKSLS